MRVSEIWTYPVKSMIGSTVARADLDTTGIVGDRRWALRDADSGALRGGKKLAAVMQCSAVGDTPDRAVITLPDGTKTATDAPDVDDLLSSAIGSPVRLHGRPLPTDGPRTREAPPAGVDALTDIRAAMGREGEEPLPDFGVFPPDVLQYEGPLAAFYDAFPLLIMTTSTMRSLQTALPDSIIDIRRFRPSIMVDTEQAPGYPEFGWPKGSRFRIGSSILEIDVPCPRCVMPTRAVDASVPADRSILRHIVRELDQNLGVYARIVSPGSVSVGDELVAL
jgi:hypothetical protein